MLHPLKVAGGVKIIVHRLISLLASGRGNSRSDDTPVATVAGANRKLKRFEFVESIGHRGTRHRSMLSQDSHRSRLGLGQHDQSRELKLAQLMLYECIAEPAAHTRGHAEASENETAMLGADSIAQG